MIFLIRSSWDDHSELFETRDKKRNGHTRSS